MKSDLSESHNSVSKPSARRRVEATGFAQRSGRSGRDFAENRKSLFQKQAPISALAVAPGREHAPARGMSLPGTGLPSFYPRPFPASCAPDVIPAPATYFEYLLSAQTPTPTSRLA